MKTHYIKDPRLLKERLKEVSKKGGDNNVEELSDKTWILNC
jgi:hypothetical protein